MSPAGRRQGARFFRFEASPGLMAADNRAAKQQNRRGEHHQWLMARSRAPPAAISRSAPPPRREPRCRCWTSPGGQYRQRSGLEDQHATSLDEALYNVVNVVQTNTLGGTQDAFTRRGFGANRDGSIINQPGLRTVLPRSFNAATEPAEVCEGPASTLYGILDPGGLINVITKMAWSGSSPVRFPGPPPALAAAPAASTSPAPSKAQIWRTD